MPCKIKLILDEGVEMARKVIGKFSVILVSLFVLFSVVSCDLFSPEKKDNNTEQKDDGNNTGTNPGTDPGTNPGTDPGDGGTDIIIEDIVDGTITNELGSTFTYGDFDWTLNSGTAGLNGDGELIINSPTADEIALQISDADWATLRATYGEQFAVEAVLVPTDASFNSNKNFGIASHISADNFYYAGVNFNGRTQIGSKNVWKGKQFGSQISDTSYLKDSWTQPYRLRYQYDNGIVSVYLNDLLSTKSGSSTWDTANASPQVTATDSTPLGVVTAGNSFLLKSFKVMGVDEGLAAIKLEAEGDFVTILEGDPSFVFLPHTILSSREGNDAITYTVTALDNAGAATTYSVSSSDTAVLEVVDNAGTFSVSPVGVGAATVTVTNSADSNVVKLISYNVEAALDFVDSDYGDYSAVYPSPAATGVFEDDHLELTFDDVPTINPGSIYIYDSEGEIADIISTGSESDTVGGTMYTLKHFMVQVDGNTLIIKPHTGILSNDTTYTVGIADGVISGAINGVTFTGFDPSAARWSFTTRSAHTVDSSAITVGISASADYRSLQAAIEASADGATITVEKGVYYEIINYEGSNDITIVGDTDAEYGVDVIIRGYNSLAYNGSSSTRCAVHWKAGDLTLKNITIQNAYDRNIDGTAQSEALYFDAPNSKLIAYNSSFLGHQDTLLTKGQNWFYKSYIEGDTDFIWGYASVALFEECLLVMLDTSNDEVKASASYIFETRVGDVSSNIVPKGYVILNSMIMANHPESFFARRATAKTSPTTYYDQVAIIDTIVGGESGINAALWSDGNEPEYIAKDSGNMHVGWKAYNIFDGALNAISIVDSKDYEGTISEDIYSAEYSDRYQIFNRVFDSSATTYGYVDYSDVWDTSEYDDEFGSTTVVPDDAPAPPSDDAPVTIEWDSSALAADQIQGGIGYINGLVDDNESGIFAVVDATTGKLTDRGDDFQFNEGAIISIPVQDGSIVTVTGYPGNYAYSLNGVEATEQISTYTHSGEATTVDIVATASQYLLSFSVSNYVIPEPATVEWDSSALEADQIQGTVGTIEGLVDGSASGVYVTVDATLGKLTDRGTDFQFNDGAIISVPVQDGSIVTVTGYPGNFAYSLNGVDATEQISTYTHSGDPTTIDIVATASQYLLSFSVSNYVVQ